MASFYGNDTGKHWQAYCEWNVTGETADTVTITGTTYFHSIAWSFQVNNINGRLTIDGNQNYTTGNRVVINNNQTANVALVTHTVTLVKGDSPRAITINAGVRSNSSYMPGYSEGAVQYTVPAKQVTTYTVTYDANGGTGAPSPQTKQKGVSLQLSTQEPTRAGYVFEGWSLTKGGVVQYKPGSYFSVDANSTLYAIWTYDRSNAPQVTSLRAYHVASSTSTTPSPSGAYVYFTLSWTSGVNLTSINAMYQLAEGTTSPMSADVKGTTTGKGGTAYGWFEGAASNSYYLSVTLENADGQSTSASIIIPKAASSIIEIANQGTGIGLLTDAPENGVALGEYANATAAFEVNVDNYETTMTGNINALVDTIVKPAISVGWDDNEGNCCNLTSQNSVFPINKVYAQCGNNSSTQHTRIWRAANYVYVSVPACQGTVTDAYFEISAQVRFYGIQNSNSALVIYCEHTAGSANTQDLQQQTGSPIITWDASNSFSANFITPHIIRLPRSLSGTNTYRFSLQGRVTNATGVVQAYTMTIKMI